jgi:hypothetical protein
MPNEEIKIVEEEGVVTPPEIPVKKKREVSDAVLANLARGREKQKLARALKKEQDLEMNGGIELKLRQNPTRRKNLRHSNHLLFRHHPQNPRFDTSKSQNRHQRYHLNQKQRLE